MSPVDDPDAPTTPTPHIADAPQPSTVVRLFGSNGFFRLWQAQIVSSTGDWIGFLALVAIAERLGGGSGAAAISLVLSARLVPGFFLAPLAGVLVDRWNRRHVMVACDLSRAAVLLSLPFLNNLWELVVASFLLEIATLLWSPAKEASVPNLVPTGHLTTANSLSLAAAYGTFPIASLLFAVLEKVGDGLADIDAVSFLHFGRAGSMAIYVDVLTFVASAAFISTLALPGARRARNGNGGFHVDFGQTFRELHEGWRFMFTDSTVRSVMLALGTGLIGGGMIVPLGALFSRDVLDAGSAGFGVLLSAMGFGMAVGVVVLSALQRRLPKIQVFTLSVIGAATALLLAASTASMTFALLCVAVLGLCSGSVYVLGFTILHESVADELRGRVFASLYTLVRFCLLLSFTIGPLLADRLDALSRSWFDQTLDVLGGTVFLPGVRLALWLAALTILLAGVLAMVSLRFDNRRK